MDTKKLDNFERAFSDHTGSCRITCHCGKIYFDNVQSWSWGEGELEDLRKDPNAKPLDYSPGNISFEGRHYVDACTCWHERAAQIMGFIDGHGHAIADYLTLEKKRKQAIADAAPVVDKS